MDTGSITEKRCNLNTPYGYSYPGIAAVTGDDCGSLLTAGQQEKYAFFTVRNDTMHASDWCGTDHTLTLFHEEKDPHFYIQNDFGFPAEISRVTACFGTADGAILPESAEVLCSDDGYNFGLYPEQTLKKSGGVYEISFAKPMLAKAVKLFVCTAPDAKTAVSDLAVYGVPNRQKRVLLSKGAGCLWRGTPLAGYEEADAALLTDGETALPGEQEKMMGMAPSFPAAVSGSQISEIALDLGAEKEVSDVGFVAHGAQIPSYITVRYSKDGATYFDLGQSFPLGRWGTGAGLCTRFCVMRNHSVTARYLRVEIPGPAVLSEVEVYGCNQPLKEPDYGYESRRELLEKTDAAEGKTVTVNGVPTDFLTDGCAETFVTLQGGEQQISLAMGDRPCVVSGLLLTFSSSSAAFSGDIRLLLSADGETYQPVLTRSFCHTVAGQQLVRLFFREQDADRLRLLISLPEGEKAELHTLSVYADQPQLPLYRGGFIQLICMDEQMENAVIKGSDYMWYLQLKGMKELGMDDVILQYGADFTNKRAAFHARRLLKKGYRFSLGMGSADPYQAIFEAAEKLSMRVYVGTITTYGSLKAIQEHGGLSHVEALLRDEENVISDIHDAFGHYSSFAGYYIADEACDHWLNQKEGFPIYRTLYLAQSRWIRALDPDRKIIISPAIWRSGNPEEGADRIFDLIRPEQDGERPIVDIVAAQDCLGRDAELAVTDATYQAYEQYVQKWAEAVRRAGAAFWSDAEVFEMTCHPKRYRDHLHTLELEAKYTGKIIAFDVPHYFSELFQGPLDNWLRFDLSSIVARYARRYHQQFPELDRIGRGGAPLKPYVMQQNACGRAACSR